MRTNAVSPAGSRPRATSPRAELEFGRGPRRGSGAVHRSLTPTPALAVSSQPRDGRERQYERQCSPRSPRVPRVGSPLTSREGRPSADPPRPRVRCSRTEGHRQTNRLQDLIVAAERDLYGRSGKSPNVEDADRQRSDVPPATSSRSSVREILNVASRPVRSVPSVPIDTATSSGAKEIDLLDERARIVPAVIVETPRSDAKESDHVSNHSVSVLPPVATENEERQRPYGLELPQLHEERSLDCTFDITFLVPASEEGQSFATDTLAAFGEVSPSEKQLVVPFGGNRTALVNMRQLGPVQALDFVRSRAHSVQTNFSDTLPEPSEKRSRSSAVVYAVHATNSMDDAERLVGPVCSVEAYYVTAVSDHRPCRFLAVLQDEAEVDTAFGAPGSFGDEVVRQLRSRGVGRLPCIAVTKGRLSSHRHFLTRIVNCMATNFCHSARKGDFRDLAEVGTVTPDTNFSRSRASSPWSVGSLLNR